MARRTDADIAQVTQVRSQASMSDGQSDIPTGGRIQMETTMPMTASTAGNDLLAQFLKSYAGHPIPLTSTRIDVIIRGGLARVTTERTFRNSEKNSIEAAMTFPVPVDATLCSLSARIDGRLLQAVAQARKQARETYEEAIDKGKSAVLHEELLKGIHMLSVAHVASGCEIAVTDTWTAPLSFIDGAPRLRIPTTVGEIYGQSPLAPSDDLVTANVILNATIGIVCEDGTASLLRAGAAKDGRFAITLDAPIDIAVEAWRSRTLRGVAADGRDITLDIEPMPVADLNLDIDLLFDHSSSMSGQASGDPEIRSSKFDVAKHALWAVAHDRFKRADRMRLWEFNDNVKFVGEAGGGACERLVNALATPAGGTEIGRAFDAVIASGKARNVVIVTDGKSYAFDPQRLARQGIRVTAVLIGDDALDAGISHLAGMTGGQAFIAAGSDAGAAIGAALDAARAPCFEQQPIEGRLTHIVTARRGARLIAAWGGQSSDPPTAEARLIGATAAMLAIPLMQEDAAASLAEHEGIVCHLTSLVLVDEAGSRHEGLPASRKVPLSTPVALAAAPVALSVDSRMLCAESPRLERLFSGAWRSFHIGGAGGVSSRDSASIPQPSAPAGQRQGSGAVIDWDFDPDALRQGDLSGLPAAAAALIRVAAMKPEVVALAKSLGIDPLVAAIGLFARESSGTSRSAGRIARAILGRTKAKDLDAATAAIGL